MKNPVIQYVIILAYFAFILFKGIRHSRDIDDQDDFLVAGRSIGWFFLLCTMSATVIGGGASLGAIGRTYSWGILMLVVSSAWYIHFIFSGLFVAPMFRKAELYTVAGFFEHRYDGRSRFVAFLLSLFFSVGVLGAQMVAFGKIITTMIPVLPYHWAVLIGGGMVILYSTAGGLYAVIHTDVYQFLILMAGFAVTLALCMPDLVSSWASVRSTVPVEFFHIDGGKGWVFLITTFLAFLLGETFAPGYATRYCVGKDIRETRKGIVGAGIFLALTFPVILFFIALYAKIHFHGIDPEQALPSTVLRLNNPVVGGLIIAALMSAVMSSADSILNSSTAIFMKDLYEKYIAGEDVDPDRGLKLSRFSSVGLGALGIILALVLPDIIDLLLLTYNLWAPGIIVPVVAGVFLKERSRALDTLILVTMAASLAATLVFMRTPWSASVQPSVFGVLFSCAVFFTGLTALRVRRSRS